MQINVTTDYGIRIVYYTSVTQRVTPSSELSNALGIPQPTVLKLGRILSKAGLITISTGVSGGFLINKDPRDIILLEVINLFEPTTRINRCLEEDEYCSRNAAKGCPVRRVYTTLQETLETALSAVTIAELIEDTL